MLAVHTMHQDILASVQSSEDLLHSTLERLHVKVLADLGPEANVPPDVMTPRHQTFFNGDWAWEAADSFHGGWAGEAADSMKMGLGEIRFSKGHLG